MSKSIEEIPSMNKVDEIEMAWDLLCDLKVIVAEANKNEVDIEMIQGKAMRNISRTKAILARLKEEGGGYVPNEKQSP